MKGSENMLRKQNKVDIKSTSLKKDISNKIISLANKDIKDILKDEAIDIKVGLKEEDINKRREEYGSNSISKGREESKWEILFKALVNPFCLVLWVVAVINAIISLFLSDADDKKTWWVTPLILVVIIVISAITTYREKIKSIRSSNALKKMTENTTLVLRNGEKKEIFNSELVVGDVVYLSAGDMVFADLRIIESKDLYVSESTLTGESDLILKSAGNESSNVSNIFSLSNIAFSGTSVTSGYGVGLVIGVGDDTIFGSLAKKVTEKKEKTPFEKGINKITRLLVTFMAIMVPLVFLVDGFGIRITASGIVIDSSDPARQWLSAFIFAISVAVGLTPSLLPMQVAANLARGASKMASKKVIVKDINSIQNLGAMDVLCTDKTGTLTENTSTLVKFMSFNEKESLSVLRLAFLNSFYQTGIRSNIDNAIISHMKLNLEYYNKMNHGITKLDELPFDFHRKRLSVLLKDKYDKTFLITKGSVETCITKISRIKLEDKIVKVEEEHLTKIRQIATKMASRGMRVVLVLAKDINKDTITLDDENDMLFAGFLCFEDTVKKSAAKALKGLNEYGVKVKILTGDSLPATISLCNNLNIKNPKIVKGSDLNKEDEVTLKKLVEEAHAFVELTPDDKYMIVSILQENGHTVGFMGDGINDAPSLKKADIGISFKEATDIAKEACDIILTESDLQVLEEGIIEGRKSYVNMMKYLKGQTSSNFGNMISQVIGAFWIPFIPMRALHIVMLDIITSISCTCLPFDNVDNEVILKPLNYSVKQIKHFMFMFGPISSLVDMSTFAFLYYYLAPKVAGGSYDSLMCDKDIFMMTFQTGFFLESLITQNVVYAFLRTEKIPFISSRPSITLALAIAVSCLIGFFIVYVPQINSFFSMRELSIIFLGFVCIMILIYFILTQLGKKIYIKKYERLL